jgi:GT2 family glycosyltransferase
VRCILKPSNSGFSATVNAGIREAQGAYILLVNNDIVFHEPGWLGHMTQSIQQAPNIAIVGARLLYSNQTIQHGGVFYSGRGNFDHRYRFLPANHPPALIVEDVNAVTGALLLIRKDLFQDVGLLSEAYYIAYEDIDLCYRAKQKGWRIIYCGAASAIHLEGQTRGTTPANKNPFWRKKEMEAKMTFWSKWMGVRF